MSKFSGLVLALAIAACATPAPRCSCAPFPSARAQIDTAEVIFVGTVIRTDVLNPQRLRTEFTVVEEIKGHVPQTVGIEHPAQGCRIDYNVGDQTWVFANTTNGALSTSLCMAPQFTEDEYRQALGHP